MEILRHSQISTTMNTYVHVLPQLQRNATTKIEELIDEPAPKHEDEDDEEVNGSEASEGCSADAESEEDSDAGSGGRPGDAADGRGSTS
jgi:hypothetical protein